MCGIIGYIGTKKAKPILINGLLRLEYRGYDSAGIATVEKDGIKVIKEKGKIANLDAMDGINDLEGTIGIGHTRWATHGKPSAINSHPHYDNDKLFAVVHNGIIENYHDLRKFLEDNGYTFLSDTDTEVIPNLINFYYKKENDFLKAVKIACDDLKGSFALEILCKYYPDNMIVVRQDSPLVIGRGLDENYISSDIPAILSFTKDFYFLNDREFAVLSRDNIDFYDNELNKIDKVVKSIEWNTASAEKDGYDDFMLKEIYEQPNAIRETIGSKLSESKISFNDFEIKKEFLETINRIYIVACGTAMHAGMVGKYVIEKLARIPVIVDIASEFRYRDPLIDKGDLVILISQSGETADTKAALELAKLNGADTLAIVNVKGSSIARAADMVVYTHAGPEISVASTKAYMVQISVMYLLAFELAYGTGRISKEQCEKYTKELQNIPSVIKEAIGLEKDCQFIASKLLNADSLLYIGRGLDYASSMEGSLKLKEISYIHSESYAAGELKHGTISLITENMPVIAVVTQKDLEEKTISNIKEVKARGAMVILVCGEDVVVEDKVADYIIRLPKAEQMLMPMVAAVPLQLIAYYTAVLKGNDVDKPRNLAKSVTVE